MIEIKFEAISPEIAEKYLLSNEMNRTINGKTVNEYAEQMKKGKWKELSGETLKFGVSGNLLDGQHRLTALKLSGRTLNFLVVRGLENNIFDVIDQGKKRSPGDVLSIAGVSSAKRHAAGIKKWAMLSFGMYGIYSPTEGTNKVSSSDFVKIYKSNSSSFDETLEMSGEWYKNSKVLSQSEYYAFFHLLKFKHRGFIKEFLNGVSTGENLEKGDARLALRNRILDSKVTGVERIVLIIKAWNNFLRGDHTERLYIGKGSEIQKIIN